MLIKFLRSSFLSQYVFVVFVALLLWFPAFLAPVAPAPPDPYSWMYQFVLQLFSGAPLFSVIFAFSLLLLEAFLLNAVLARYQLIGRVSLLGAFLFVLLMSLLPAQTMLYPMLLAMPLLIIALSFLFKMYETTDNELNLFNVSFLVSLASLFWFPAIVLLVWIYIALLVLAIANLRYWIIPLIGLFTPYLFMAFFFFMRNELIGHATAYLNLFEHLNLMPDLPAISDLLTFGLMLLIALKAFQIAYSGIVDNNIAIRKRKAIMNALIFSSILLFFFETNHIAHQMLIVLPFVSIMAFSYTYLKKYRRADFFLFLLLLLALLNQYLSLLR